MFLKKKQRWWTGMAFLGMTLGLGGTPGVDETVVLANSAEPESVRLAEAYGVARGIPSKQIITLPMPLEETISGPQFVEAILNPLRRELVERGLMDGTRHPDKDGFGRERYQWIDNSVSYLAVCKGVPLRIEEQEAWLTDGDRQRLPEPFHFTRGSVDAQLTLLVNNDHPFAGPLNNPFFEVARPNFLQRQQIIGVARLDGPSYRAARAIFERSIEAEEKGTAGRAYVDQGGRHPTGEQWLGEAAEVLRKAGFDLTLDPGKDLFAATDRFDAPLIYLGWYADHVSGVWKDGPVLVPRGAIGLHLHSFSATTVRSTGSRWVGPLVGAGVGVVPGNVYEPYLETTLRPQLFVRALLEGKNVADASLFSMPALNWQQVIIGDPLYRPFALPNDKVIERMDRFDPLRQYAVIRKMNLLEADGDSAGAIRVGRRYFGESPGLALALRTSQLMIGNDREDEARQFLGFLRHFQGAAPEEAIVAVELAEILNQLGDAGTAFRVFQELTSRISSPESLRREIHARGAPVARAAGEASTSGRWQSIGSAP